MRPGCSLAPHSPPSRPRPPTVSRGMHAALPRDSGQPAHARVTAPHSGRNEQARPAHPTADSRVRGKGLECHSRKPLVPICNTHKTIPDAVLVCFMMQRRVTRQAVFWDAFPSHADSAACGLRMRRQRMCAGHTGPSWGLHREPRGWAQLRLAGASDSPSDHGTERINANAHRPTFLIRSSWQPVTTCDNQEVGQGLSSLAKDEGTGDFAGAWWLDVSELKHTSSRSYQRKFPKKMVGLTRHHCT